MVTASPDGLTLTGRVDSATVFAEVAVSVEPPVEEGAAGAAAAASEATATVSAASAAAWSAAALAAASVSLGAAAAAAAEVAAVAAALLAASLSAVALACAILVLPSLIKPDVKRLVKIRGTNKTTIIFLLRTYTKYPTKTNIAMAL